MSNSQKIFANNVIRLKAQSEIEDGEFSRRLGERCERIGGWQSNGAALNSDLIDAVSDVLGCAPWELFANPAEVQKYPQQIEDLTEIIRSQNARLRRINRINQELTSNLAALAAVLKGIDSLCT